MTILLFIIAGIAEIGGGYLLAMASRRKTLLLGDFWRDIARFIWCYCNLPIFYVLW